VQCKFKALPIHISIGTNQNTPAKAVPAEMRGCYWNFADVVGPLVNVVDIALAGKRGGADLTPV
jgi:hypothetical protein